MKLLVIGSVWPEPQSSAAGSRMMQLLHAFLQRGHSITFGSAAEHSDHSENLEALGITCQALTVNCASFDTFVSHLYPDAVLFDRFMIEEQFGWRVEAQCPKAMRILDMEDFHSLREARELAVKSGESSKSTKPHSEKAFREIASILRCDLTLVISPFEKDLLVNHYKIPPTQLITLPFLLPSTPPLKGPSFEERSHFVSIGNFRHAPNWDAVLELKRLWPRIRSVLPKAEIHIYGSYLTKKATQLDNKKDGFRILGRADSVAEVMQRSRVCLAPLRFGAGLKGKLLDAMLAGTPSVTTAIGAEGMTPNEIWPGAIVDGDDAFTAAALALYSDPEQWAQAQASITQLLRLYDAAPLEKQLFATIAAIQENLEGHRESHFFGAMLRHHSLKSHRYMALWIEAKNASP